MGGSPSRRVTTIPRLGGYWSSAKGDTNYLICHVMLQNHVNEGSCNLLSGSSSCYVTTLPSLVVIGIVVVEMRISIEVH